MAEAIGVLGAIGLAGNIVQFVDFASKLIATAAEVQKNGFGSLQETREIDVVMRDLQGQLKMLTHSAQLSRDPELAKLLQMCLAVASELSAITGPSPAKAGRKNHFNSVIKAM
jgi:hypothetical protein